MVVIRGFGCNFSRNHLTETAATLMMEAHASITSVDVLCNPSTKNMAKNIRSRLLGRDIHATEFVLAAAKFVADVARTRKKVILVGHSYGGSVVGRVVGVLDTNATLKNKISSATVGTIYIPRNSTSTDHFIYTFDIAILCNKYVKGPHIAWMAPPPRKGPVGVHFEYGYILSDIAQHARVPSTYPALSSGER